MKIVKKYLKRKYLDFGIYSIFREINRSPRVLFWHGVSNECSSIVEAENIKFEVFKSQILYLKNKFEIISIEEYRDRLHLNCFTKKEVVLTFDDGYKNNLSVVAPYLSDLKIPFTVFITTNNINHNLLFPTSIIRLIIFGSQLKEIDIPSIKIKTKILDFESKKYFAGKISELIKTLPLQEVKNVCDELISNISTSEMNDLIFKYSSILPMNWDDVEKLKNYNCTIGSHCLDHICCHKNQEKEEIKFQITESKKVIENKLKLKCNFFAYPNGDFHEFSDNCVKEAGYDLGFSTQRKSVFNKDINKSSLPRISVPASLDTLKILLSLKL
ncbi:MAG: polysaccharide deacetylase family protein [Bacteroidales bacterium]|nr:polysaccharide deacetylase family protein [Bacteroidales bacterium]